MNNNEQTPKKAIGKKRVFLIIAAILIIAFLIYFFSIDVPKGSQDMGLDGYTQEELDKMFPQIENADVPTRTTPEQTYALLKEALKNEDVEAAADCFAEKVREEWRGNLQEIKEKGYMQEMHDDLTELTLEQEGEAIRQYSYGKTVDEEIYGYYINFTKDSNGDWKIESL